MDPTGLPKLCKILKRIRIPEGGSEVDGDIQGEFAPRPYSIAAQGNARKGYRRILSVGARTAPEIDFSRVYRFSDEALPGEGYSGKLGVATFQVEQELKHSPPPTGTVLRAP